MTPNLCNKSCHLRVVKGALWCECHAPAHYVSRLQIVSEGSWGTCDHAKEGKIHKHSPMTLHHVVYTATWCPTRRAILLDSEQ